MSLSIQIAAVAALTAPVFAQTMNPANGHFYQVVDANISWTAADAEASSALLNGVTGHLVTITSPAESDWILANLAPSRAWIGLAQNPASPNFAEPAGGFEWVTGETSTFTNWNPGEPNNISGSGGSEDFVEMFANGDWNDTEDNHTPTNQYIVEWSGGGLITSTFCSANPNSTGVPGLIGGMGSNAVADNNVTLTVSNVPAFQFGIFVVSDTAGASVPLNEGILCLSGDIGRYQQAGQIYQADANGNASFMIDVDAIPRPMSIEMTMPGDTWYFQAWHRDFVNGDPGQGNTSNFTTGMEVTFS